MPCPLRLRLTLSVAFPTCPPFSFPLLSATFREPSLLSLLWGQRDSSSQPSDLESDALPLRQGVVVDMVNWPVYKQKLTQNWSGLYACVKVIGSDFDVWSLQKVDKFRRGKVWCNVVINSEIILLNSCHKCRLGFICQEWSDRIFDFLRVLKWSFKPLQINQKRKTSALNPTHLSIFQPRQRNGVFR